MASIQRSIRRSIEREDFEKKHGYSMWAGRRAQGKDLKRQSLQDKKDAKEKTPPIKLIDRIKSMLKSRGKKT